jgi:molybdenum ABC transporter molybdate-binding protein
MAASRSDTTGEPSGWGVGLRVWVERAGRAVLGPGRLELLEAIDRHHSISAAARQMSMSYRHAWVTVQQINEAAGEPLVAAATGGVGGGGAQLTPLGRWAVSAFRDLSRQLHQAAETLVPGLTDADPSSRLVPERTGGACVHVAAAVSLEEALGRILNDFAPGNPSVRVRAVFGASDELADQLLAGARFDLFLTADVRHLDRLAAARRTPEEPPRVLAENRLALIGPAGAGPAVRTSADLARGGIRLALAEPGCPLGDYTRAYLEGLHLYEPLLRRAVRSENSRSVLAAVRAGQADAGLVYASDAARAEGCRTLFRPRQAVPIRYAGAVLLGGPSPAPARRLLDFLASAEAARRFRECGFSPAGRPRRGG